MPTVADRRTTPATDTRAPRRRRRTESAPSSAAAALQRSLDRRDNGGVTGHDLH